MTLTPVGCNVKLSTISPEHSVPRIGVIPNIPGNSLSLENVLSVHGSRVNFYKNFTFLAAGCRPDDFRHLQARSGSFSGRQVLVFVYDGFHHQASWQLVAEQAIGSQTESSAVSL
jgi:hypothetical protein